MEPSPPKTLRSRKYINRPFYESGKKTSAEIISEARSSVHVLDTKRPFTPAEANRSLFGSNGREGRPPSVCSIASSYTESRPPTGKRLMPIDQVPNFKELEEKLYYESTKLQNPKHPKDTVMEHLLNNNNNNNTENNNNEHLVRKSVDNSVTYHATYSSDPKFSKTVKQKQRIASPTNRRVQSGPKERTNCKEGTEVNKRSNSFGDLRNDSAILSNNEDLNKDKETICFEVNIRPLLKQMELNHLHGDVDALLVNFEILWKTLEISNMLGKSKLGTKRRSEILTATFKCTSDDNVILWLKLSRLFLALEVTGKNLEVVCKLLFRVGRNKKHDELFIKEKLIEPILGVLSSSKQFDLIQSLVYLTGTLKFLSLNSLLVAELIKYDVLKSISNLLHFTKEELSTDVNQNIESCHMLVQVTSALSNLANLDSLRENFLNYNIPQLLLELTKTRYKDIDYFINISKIFSKLTMSAVICININNQDYEILMTGLKFHFKIEEIAVRLCYAFGNIASNLEEAREQITYTYKGLDIFLLIAQYYFESFKKNDGDIKEEKSLSVKEDVLIKIVRVIANLAMDERCANSFSDNDVCIQVLLSIIEKGKDYNLPDEVIMNSAATVNNLSFYATDGSKIMQEQEDFANALSKMLVFENMDCILEALRVLGNFTQSKTVRVLLLKNKIFEVLVTLLDSSDSEVVYCACGVLINLMVDVSTRPLLKQHKGIPRLIEVLRDLAESDWSFAGMICQILWNYSENITTSIAYFGENETDNLITVLNESLEPELALDYEGRSDISEETIELLKEAWHEQFKPVAIMLLKRIESHHSNLEPLIGKPN